MASPTQDLSNNKLRSQHGSQSTVGLRARHARKRRKRAEFQPGTRVSTSALAVGSAAS